MMMRMKVVVVYGLCVRCNRHLTRMYLFYCDGSMLKVHLFAELQLTKLSRPATKIIKRVAPGGASQGEGAAVQSPPQGSNPQIQRKSSQQQKNAEKRANDSRSSQVGFQRQRRKVILPHYGYCMGRRVAVCSYTNQRKNN